jgi:hypothetical protein
MRSDEHSTKSLTRRPGSDMMVIPDQGPPRPHAGGQG